ncbi:MFS transporter, partial [Streptomyces noursei]
TTSPGASYVVDVLPGLVVLGAGMVTLVAPLTATVLASVDVDRAGLASGINNAAARAAGLVAVAALPLLAGMGPEAYRSAPAFAAAFRRAMPLCAAVLLLGALIAWLTVRGDVLRPTAPETAEPCHAECTYHCGVTAPPLDPGEDHPEHPPP